MSGFADFARNAPQVMGGKFPLREIPAGEYADMRWPKFPPLMRFHVRRYALTGFGHLMVMETRALGLMELTTASFMPSAGAGVPFLLIDMMRMGKKRTVFVEYYDCTADGAVSEQLRQVKEQFDDLAEYAEKPAWYVGERMDCSLIKGGDAGQEQALLEMAEASVAAYARQAAKASVSSDNLEGLSAFAQRMVREGNPSSATMERVLGKAGAEKFFRTVVMPVNKIEEEAR